MTAYVKNAGVWKPANMFPKSGGAWSSKGIVWVKNAGVWKPVTPGPLSRVIVGLGLGTNVKVVLDAGDAASLPAASTKWLDTSGNGYDFFRGSTASAEATDPTINGTADGLSAAEYLSFDGGDFLRYDAANETWMQNLHKAGAKSSCVCWLWCPSLASSSIYGTSAADPTRIGVDFIIRSNGAIQFSQRNGVSTGVSVSATALLNAGAWNFAAYGMDAATGTITIQTNGTQESLGIAYVSPSAASASYTMDIGSRGNANTNMINTSRMGGFAIWEGRALTAAELSLIYQGTRGRYGV